jgi:hypothetical protein
LTIGIGHGGNQCRGGYTYRNPQTGHEFSGVLGSICISIGAHRNS